MKVINREALVMIDCDDTLVMHVDPEEVKYVADFIEVKDPLSEEFITVMVNEPMVRLLREEHHRGSCVVVWSRGGCEWARNVIRALGLENQVDYVMSKPLAYFDDKPIQEWLPYRVYIKPDTIYKNKG